MADDHSGASTAEAGSHLAHMGEILSIYGIEAGKRLRPEGMAQFLELKNAESSRFKSMGEDPWSDPKAVQEPPPLVDGSHCKFLIFGGGFGGVVFAVRLIQAGFSADDIRLVDPAGGFGGTWYWNRYPGLRCDVDSSIYLPFLEETGYIPKMKYSSGPEILEHVNRVVEHWNLTDKCLFRARARDASWQDERQRWATTIVQNSGQEIRVTSQYVLVASGVLTRPQIPKIPGLESFAGEMFHTARWNYHVTGGSPTDPTLTKLADKRVGIIGTGCTAVQVAPQLARWAKDVFVFQRTPSAVHWRGNQEIDPAEWKSQVATHENWQLERMANFNAYVAKTYGPPPEKPNLVADAWTELAAYGAIIGSPTVAELQPTPDKIAEHVGKLHALDLPVAERVRARVDEIVEDKDVAKRLKAWYPSWCKRPAYSDEYLQCFNQPNVTLVDTDGRGVEAASETGLSVDGKEIPLDVLVHCTGYISPAVADGSFATRMDLKVTGRDGLDFNHKWLDVGAATLHGIMTNGFPNLFFIGTTQSGAAANFTHTIMVMASHATRVIKEAEKRASGPDAVVIVEVTHNAEEAWTMQCLQRAPAFSGVATCTPGYITSEGERTKGMATASLAEQMKMGRVAGWGEGMGSYQAKIDEWFQEGSLAGVEVKA